MTVRRVEKLDVRLELKGISVSDPNPRQSFLEKTDQETTLWLASEASENQYPWLIGDALQDHFGDVKELSAFVEDLLTKNKEDVLTRWKQKGLQTDICVPSSEENSKAEVEKSPEPTDENLSVKIADRNDVLEPIESGLQTPEVHEGPETDEENGSSMEDKPKTPTYTPSTRRPRRSGEHSTSGSSRANASGSRSGRRGDTEGDTHAEKTDIPHHTTQEIEYIGMEQARCYEEGQGCTVEDVSTENLGFDLRSTTPDGEIRCIEVKARAERALVVLTSNEWKTAQRLKNRYFLYVVLNAATQPELYIIQNPADEVAMKERIEVRYQISLWQIMEHGEPV